MIIEKCNIKFVFEVDEKGASVTAHDLATDSYSTRPCFIQSKQFCDIVTKIESAKNKNDLCKILSSANEVANFALISGSKKIVDDILIALNLALPPSEKEIIAHGEVRENEDFRLSYEDIVNDLHFICDKVPFEEFREQDEYEISRSIVKRYMATYLMESTDLPYNEVVHHNWNVEYGVIK